MTVTVSSKYQVVIPEEIRRSTGIRPGQKVDILKYGNHVALVPVPDPKSMRGFLKGANLNGYRDKKDRL
jgi:AbrB family looped-hinge helix DNA binding protein